MQLDPVLDLVLRGSFAVLFGWSLWHKVAGYDRFVLTVAAYFRDSPLAVPAVFRSAALISLLWEGAALAACLLPVDGWIRAGLVGGVLLLYALGMGLNVLRGNILLDCGCSFGAARHPVSHRLVLRNIGLAVLAAVMAVSVSARELTAMDYVTVVAGSLVAILVFFAADGAFQNYLQPMGGKQ